MSAVAGTGIIDIVPNMQTLGAGLASASGPLQSGLSTLAKTIGVTLGAAAVVSFVKSSVAAFDELEASSQRLEFGLEKIGQGTSLEPILAWAKAFSLQTGINEAEIVSMSSKLEVLGAAFFRAAGPQAASYLEALTQGLTDMAAATGKTAASLMKSLAPTILNNPAAALATLTKLGTLTTEQATKVRDLVDAGRLQEATQLEITAVQEKYNGAAAETATLTDKLANVWNQLNLAVGGFVNNILSKAVDGLGKMSPLLKQVAGAIGLAAVAMVTLNGISNSFVGSAIAKMLVGLRGLIVEFALVAEMEGVAAAGAGVFGAALGLLATPAIAFTLALAGVGLAIVSVKNLLDKAGKEGQTWADDILAGKNSLGELNTAVNEVTGNTSLSDWWNGDKITIAAFDKATTDLVTKLQDVPGVLSAADAAQVSYDLSLGDGAGAARIIDKAMVRYNATLDSSRSHLDAAGKAVRNFANMTTKDLKSFASGIANALDPVSGVVNDMTSTFGDSAKKVAKSFRDMVAAAKRWARDLTIINNSGLTDAQKKVLLANQQLGDAWVRGNARIKASIETTIGQLGNAQDKINAVKGAILGVPALKIDVGSALSALQSVIDKAHQISMDLPHRAMGGPVFGGQPVTVGERGSETFVPYANGTIIPHGAGRAASSAAPGSSRIKGVLTVDIKGGVGALDAELSHEYATSGW